MNEHIILIEKVSSNNNFCQNLSIISGTPFRIPSKGPIRITVNPKAAPLIITTPGPISYSSEKVVPWNYGADVYYHGVKKELSDKEDKKVDPSVVNITKTNKITRSGRIFSPEISLPVQITTAKTTAGARGKESMIEPSQMEAPTENVVRDTFEQDLEEVLKIICRSDYKIVEQLGQIPSKISMLSLLMCSTAHAKV